LRNSFVSFSYDSLLLADIRKTYERITNVYFTKFCKLVLYDLFNLSAISSCTADCRSLCEIASEYFRWNFCTLIGFFLLVSVNAAKVVEMPRKDSSTLSHLAYFDKVYLTRHGQFFFLQKSVYLFKVTSSHIFTRKLTSSRLQVGFGPSQVGFTK